MAFSDFSFPQVQQDLGLTLAQAELFRHVPPAPIREEFVAIVDEGAKISLGMNTEKAKSEFIIAPILLELRRLLAGAVGIFSGVEFNVDPSRGLTGVCDFILSKSEFQYVLRAPLVSVVEAKNDNLRHGYAQCIAEMYASDLYNQRHGVSLRAVYGAVTTGGAWKFLRLEGTTVTLDLDEYYIGNLGKILGILKHIIETS